jgi:C-terminal processing protease CtpA/Prc
MALQTSPGSIVVGSTTSGADGNVSEIRFPGGERAAISGIGVFYPDRRPAQRAGVAIDVKVRPTIAGIRAGRDEVLETAVEKLTGRKLVRPLATTPRR